MLAREQLTRFRQSAQEMADAAEIELRGPALEAKRRALFD